MVSAPSPLITDMREASGRISDLSCRIYFWRRSDRDAQRVHEAWKELKDRGRCHQFQNLLVVVGGFQPGEAVHLFKQGPDALRDGVAAALRGLQTLIDRYDEPDRCYLARPYPAWKPRFSHYEQLARVAEWSLAGDEDEA